MSEPSSKMAKGGLLMGVAAVITAVVPLITSDVGERADRADKKSELVLELIKQHLEFLGKEVDGIKEDNRELRSAIRQMYMWTGEGTAEEMAPEPPPPPPPMPRSSGGGGDTASTVLTLEDILEEGPLEPSIQKQAPIPTSEQLNALLDKK